MKKEDAFLDAREALQFTDKSNGVLETDFEGDKLRRIGNMPDYKRWEYWKEVKQAKNDPKNMDAKERRLALSDIDIKYEVHGFDELAVKRGVVSKVYAIENEQGSKSHAVLLESINGKAYFIPTLDKPNVKEGQFITADPVMGLNGHQVPYFEKVSEKFLVTIAKENGYNNNLTQYIEQKKKEKVLENARSGVTEKESALPDARDALKFTDKSKLEEMADLQHTKWRLIDRMPDYKRWEYWKEIKQVTSDTKDMNVKEQRKAVFEVDKKYGINVFDEVVKKGVVSKVYTLEDELGNKSHAVLLESIDGKAYLIPTPEKPNVKEGQLVQAAPVMGQNKCLMPGFTKMKEKDLIMEAKQNGYNNNLTQHIERKEKERSLENKRGGIEL
jgi:hypothetical protein